MEWDALLMELRQTVLAKQEGGQPGPPAAIPYAPDPESAVSSLPFPVYHFTDTLPVTHAYWQVAPDTEACLRRFYTCLTSGPGGGFRWALLESTAGIQYLTILRSKFLSILQRLRQNEEDLHISRVMEGIEGNIAVNPPPLRSLLLR